MLKIFYTGFRISRMFFDDLSPHDIRAGTTDKVKSGREADQLSLA